MNPRGFFRIVGCARVLALTRWVGRRIGHRQPIRGDWRCPRAFSMEKMPWMHLKVLSFTPQMREFGKQIDLNLLDFDQPLPLVRQQMIDFVVQLPDFKFGF